MPKVRASSGTIGTINFPSAGSRIRLRSNFAKAIVVLTGAALPAANSSSTAASGGVHVTGWTTRDGSGPPSAARRSVM